MKSIKEGIREVRDLVEKTIVMDHNNGDAVVTILDKLEALEDLPERDTLDQSRQTLEEVRQYVSNEETRALAMEAWQKEAETVLEKVRAITEQHEPIKIARDYFREKGMKKLTCCICGCDFYDWTGHNPDPVVPDGEDLPCCCQSCNDRFVIPARMKH